MILLILMKPGGPWETSSQKILRNLRFLKQCYYEHGRRARKLLAFQFKKQMYRKFKILTQISPFYINQRRYRELLPLSM